MRTEEFLAFAKSYLSEAFPNHQRIDCPLASELIRMAERHRDADPSISEPLSCCSPCLKEYTDIVADMKGTGAH